MHYHRAGNPQHQRQQHALPADFQGQQQRVPKAGQVVFHNRKIHRYPPSGLPPVVDFPGGQVAQTLQ